MRTQLYVHDWWDSHLLSINSGWHNTGMGNKDLLTYFVYALLCVSRKYLHWTFWCDNQFDLISNNDPNFFHFHLIFSFIDYKNIGYVVRLNEIWILLSLFLNKSRSKEKSFKTESYPYIAGFTNNQVTRQYA